MSKPTRRLTDIKFEHEGAHVALVGKHQGGPANGITTLITKATAHIDQASIEKATEVTVSLQFPEFLRKLFGMYWEDAEVLSMALGYGSTDEFDWEGKTYKEWLDYKVQSMNIMKSVYKSQDVNKALAELTPEQTLALLADQELLEKAMSSALPEGASLKDNPVEDNTLEKIEKALHEELLEKAVLAAVEVEKAAFAAQELVLKAAQEKLAEYEAAAQAAVEKSRKEALKGADITDDKVEELMKSLAPLDAEAFDAVVATFMVQKAAAADSEMFVEKGVAGAGELDQKEVDRTAAILKARYTK